MNTLRRAEAIIDLEKIKHNFLQIRQHTSGAAMICVIKADAYGHGAVKLAHLYEKLGAEMLAVACLDEALELRRANVRLPILILGATPVSFAKELCENNIIQTVFSLPYAEALNAEAEALGQHITVHIKIDTGMTRLGIYAHRENLKSATDQILAICKLPNLDSKGIFTHFAESENSDIAYTEEQFSCFSALIDALSSAGKTFDFCHCANSAAVVNYKWSHLNCVRPGLILYGCSPYKGAGEKLDLRPAMTLRYLVADVREIKNGDTVSYNRRFTAPRDMRIAVICCGYADGLHRSLSGKGCFLIRGKRAPMIGNICMDLTIVDVTDIPDASPFDEAILFGEMSGEKICAEELAEICGTISYELLTSVSKRVPRTYRNDFA